MFIFNAADEYYQEVWSNVYSKPDLEYYRLTDIVVVTHIDELSQIRMIGSTKTTLPEHNEGLKKIFLENSLRGTFLCKREEIVPEHFKFRAYVMWVSGPDISSRVISQITSFLSEIPGACRYYFKSKDVLRPFGINEAIRIVRD